MYKKIMVVFLIFSLVAFSGCTSTTSTTNTQQTNPSTSEKPTEPETTTAETTTEAPTEETVEGVGKLGKYDIEILGFEITQNYEGKDSIVVTYKFTNNDEEAKNFTLSISTQAFQDGIELSSTIISDDDGNGYKDIKTGATLEVKVAYILSNLESPVEVEASELISFNKDKVSKTFEIK